MADELTPGQPGIERLAPSELPAAIVTAIRAAEEAGAAREREACACMAEWEHGNPSGPGHTALTRLAAAIRERGKP